MSEKIQPTHLERAAVVYVRQSSVQQVRHHLESQRRQYGLAERARQLGFREVLVIDDDLGRSGSGAQERPGFGRLLAAVCEGRIGGVFALEASRLARNNRDWHHLVDLCALTEALVIDDDGVYDPRQLNDRLLLGLKGTMSEFELGLLRQRGQEAFRQMVARGEVLWEVAVGYQRTRGNGIEMTPDRQIQGAVRGVFDRFRQLGSARQVFLWHRQEQVLLPHLEQGGEGAEVIWKLPVYNRVLGILRNPVYAGAFVHGRTGVKVAVRDGRARKTYGHRLPLGSWPVLIREHHPGYISWEEYVRNQEQLASNTAMQGAMGRGAPKSGAALLAGLLRCGRCGRKLRVGYSGVGGRIPRYHCRDANLNTGAPSCLSFAAQRADQAVAAAVLEAVAPAGARAALDAWSSASAEQGAKREALALALEKARYEASRARRQYDAVDPENRLVAGELEARWNDALQAAAELEGRLAAVPDDGQRPTDREQERLLALGQDLEAAWYHPQAPAALKKRILRTVLEEIVVDASEAPPQVGMWLHWAGGVHTQLAVPRNPVGKHRRCTTAQVVDLVSELAKVCSDRTIAWILNRLGCRTGTEQSFTEARVRFIRHHYKIPVVAQEGRRSWVTLQEAAVALELSPGTVRRMIERGLLRGSQVVSYAPWVIPREELQRECVQAAARAIREGRRIPRTLPGQPRLLKD